MSLDAARQAIFTEVERARAAWTAYTLQVEYENRDRVDLSKVTKSYACLDILWARASQMDLGLRPKVNDYGTILLTVGTKQGNGSTDLLKLLDHFRPYLQLRDNIGGGVRTQEGHIQKPYPAADGFYYYPLSVPFWVENVAPPVP